VLTRLLSRWLAQAKADFNAGKAPEQQTTPAKQAVPDSGGSSSRGIAASAWQGSVIHGGQGQRPSMISATNTGDVAPPLPRDVFSRPRTQGTSSDELARRAATSLSDEAPRLVDLQKVQPYGISVTAKLRTASDVQRAKDLCYQQSIEGRVLSEQDKTRLDDYHEGIRSQQAATLRATEVKKKSATANATGIMSMEVAVLRFSEDVTHGDMDIVLQQTTLSLAESQQQGSMTRAAETLVQCAQKNGSVWDVNRVSIVKYRASSPAPTIVYQGGSPQYSNATFYSCAHKDKRVRFDYVMYLSEHQSAAVEFLKTHGHLKVSRMELTHEDDKKAQKPVDPTAKRCDQCTSNSKKKSFCLYTHQAPLVKDSFEKVQAKNDVKECQEVLERARSLIRFMESSPPASEVEKRRFQETRKIVTVLERTTLPCTGMPQSASACAPDSSQTAVAPASQVRPNPIFKVKHATRRRNAVEKLASTSDSFMCPIGHELFQDPVVAADGHTYERSKIEE
jgi:hypothetical protein